MKGLFDKDDTAEKAKSFIRVGEVTSINVAACTARVTFDDDNGITSFDLPVIQRNTFKNSDYQMPDIGEDVLCVFLPSGTEEGFIIGSWYAGEVTPPESSEDKRTVVFADGTKISYDRAAHELTATIEGTKIKANRQNVDVETPQQVNVKAAQQVNVEGGASINLTAPVVTLTVGGTTMRLDGSQATITSENVRLTGSLYVTGNMAVKGNASVDGTGSFTGNVSAPNV